MADHLTPQDYLPAAIAVTTAALQGDEDDELVASTVTAYMREHGDLTQLLIGQVNLTVTLLGLLNRLGYPSADLLQRIARQGH